MDFAAALSMVVLLDLKPTSNELSKIFRELFSFFTGDASREKLSGFSVEYD